MNKIKVLQVLAIINFLMGVYLLFDYFMNKNSDLSILSGLSPLLMGIALFVISKSKAVSGKKTT